MSRRAGTWLRPPAAPGLASLLRYRREWLRGDLVAGVTVAAYLIPQVMAYAEVAGLPAIVGLWTIMVSLAVYAMVGSSRQLSVGPESTTALMTAVTVAPLAAGDPERYATLSALLALMVGAWCLLGYLARIGFLGDLFSRPVLVGYLAGIAVLMIVSQLEATTGVEVDGDTLTGELRSAFSAVDAVHGPTLIVAVATLVFLFVAAARLPKAPVPLIAILLAAAAVAVFSLADAGVQLVGEVPAGLPSPDLPAVTGADVSSLIAPAAGIAVVGYTDNILTARAFASRRGDHIDANQELLALGAVNIAAGVFRGFPVSSSGSRTVIGDSMGSRSQLHSLAALAVLAVTLLIGRDLLAAFPRPALGAIVVYAAVRLVDVAELRRIAAFRRSELVLALSTTVAVTVLGVLDGIVVAVVISVADLLRRVARPHDGILGRVPGLAGMHDVDDYPSAERVPGLVVYRYDAPLFFANAEDFRRRAIAAVEVETGPVEWFLLNAEANVEIDITGIDALEELRATLARRGIVFAMARVKQDLRDDLKAGGLIERVGEEYIFPTLPTALDGFASRSSNGPRPT